MRPVVATKRARGSATGTPEGREERFARLSKLATDFRWAGDQEGLAIADALAAIQLATGREMWLRPVMRWSESKLGKMRKRAHEWLDGASVAIGRPAQSRAAVAAITEFRLVLSQLSFPDSHYEIQNAMGQLIGALTTESPHFAEPGWRNRLSANIAKCVQRTTPGSKRDDAIIHVVLVALGCPDKRARNLLRGRAEARGRTAMLTSMKKERI